MSETRPDRRSCSSTRRAWARAAAAAGRGPAASGDPRRPARRRASGCRPRACSRRIWRSRAAWSATPTGSSRPRAGSWSRRGRARGWRPRRERRRCAPEAAVEPRRRSATTCGPGRPDFASFPRVDWLRSLSAAVRGAGRRRARLPADGRLAAPARGARRLPRPRARDARHRRRRDHVRGRGAGVHHGRGRARAGAGSRSRTRATSRSASCSRGAGSSRCRCRSTSEGIVVDALPDDARAVLVTPAHQFPTGVVLSPARRAELLRVGRTERGAIIVEDDYDAEYRYDRAPVGALQGLRPDLVVHVGSVSKTLAPALRLGWLIAPAGVARAPARRPRGARPRPARARADRARRLHRARRLRPPPAPHRARLPPPPRRADRRARALPTRP